MNQTDHFLLPEGQTVDLNGKKLTITKRLSGSGLTSEVYKGVLAIEGDQDIPVAIKAMKSLNFQQNSETRRMFDLEAEALSTIEHEEEQINKEQELNIRTSPFYYGMGEYENIPYIVMEFIAGEQIPDLLARAKRLSEPQVLTITWHLFRVLDILHTRMKKTYIDLKFENLWWVESADGGYLKMTDFGTLADIRPDDTKQRDVRNDLLISSIYFLAMLSGYVLPVSLGELQERADSYIRAVPASWGTRQLLRKLLHHNPDQRPQTAASIVLELRTLINFWRQPLDKAIDIAYRNIQSAEEEKDQQSAKKREFATRARSALDIVCMRAPDKSEDIQSGISSAEQLLAISDYTERGKILFGGNSFEEARELFIKGLEWSEEPAVLRRWAYLSTIGIVTPQKVFLPHKDEAVKIIEQLNRGDYRHASDRIQYLKGILCQDSKGLTALEADCALSSLLKQAGDAKSAQNYEAAAQAFRQGIQWLNQLPDKDWVSQNEVGDLLVQAEEMEYLNTTQGALRACMDNARQAAEKGDWGQAMEQVNKAFPFLNDNKLAEDLWTMSWKALSANEFTTAYQIAETGLRAGLQTNKLVTVYRYARELSQANLFVHNQDAKGVVLKLQRLQAGLAGYRGNSPQERVSLDRAVAQIITAAGQSLKTTNDLELLLDFQQIQQSLTLPEGSLNWLSERIKQIREERRTRTYNEVNDRLTHVLNIMQKPEFGILAQSEKGYSLAEIGLLLVDIKQRTELAKKLLDECDLLVVDEPLRARVEELRGKVDAKLMSINLSEEKNQQDRQKKRQQSIETMNSQYELLDKLEQWAHKAEEAGANEEVKTQLNHQKAGYLQAIISVCLDYLGRVDAGDETFKQNLEKASAQLNDLGSWAWLILANRNTDQINRAQTELVRAKKLYQDGKAIEAMHALSTVCSVVGMTHEYGELIQKCEQAINFTRWNNSNQDFWEAGKPSPEATKQIRFYLNMNIAPIYWKNSPALLYLQKVRTTAKNKLQSNFEYAKSPEFIELIRNWVDAEVTLRRTGTLTGAQDTIA